MARIFLGSSSAAAISARRFDLSGPIPLGGTARLSPVSITACSLRA
jgi:hypothetical protein